VKTMPTKGTIHNAYVTPDGKYVVAGSIAGKTVNVFDEKTWEPAWVLDMDLGIRPMAFAANADGSTKWIFVQLTDFNGFAVVDFATHKEVNRIKNPDLPPGKSTVPEGSDPSHGMAVTADNKTLVVTSRQNSALYAYSLPDLKLLGGADVGAAPDWVTLTPDSKTAYVANAGSNDIGVLANSSDGTFSVTGRYVAGRSPAARARRTGAAGATCRPRGPARSAPRSPPADGFPRARGPPSVRRVAAQWLHAPQSG